MQEILNYQIGLKTAFRQWTATPDSLRRLLHWLDNGVDSQGQKYEEMRQRLVTFFDRKNCSDPDELADETLNRVMKWLDQKQKDHDSEPAKICYNTARFVWHEYLRRPEQARAELDDVPLTVQPIEDPRVAAGLTEAQAIQERRIACLENCFAKLLPEERELILRYYSGEQRAKLENRKALATERGMSANALSIKACRVRDKLRNYMRDCLC